MYSQHDNSTANEARATKLGRDVDLGPNEFLTVLHGRAVEGLKDKLSFGVEGLSA